MGILETGENHLAAALKNLRLWSDQRPDLLIASDGEDAAFANGDGLGPASDRIDRVDGGIEQDEVGGCGLHTHKSYLSYA